MPARRKRKHTKKVKSRRCPTGRQLKIESLEERAMMAADVGLENGLLQIDAGPESAHVQVSEIWNHVVVSTRDSSGRQSSHVFSKSDVDRLIFNGGPSSDYFQNNTDIADQIYGGGGADRLFGGSSRTIVYGGAGRDEIDGGSGNDFLRGEDGNDVIRGGEGHDRVFGDAGSDVLSGGNGHDKIFGGWGNDTIYGNAGDDTIRGGGGADVLNGSAGHDRIFGEAGDDTIWADGLWAPSGNDYVEGGRGNDTIFGGGGNDTIKGHAGNDRLHGGAGNDRILGGEGNDQIKGGMGNDVLDGQGGNDRVDGEAGDDHVRGGRGRDMLYGGDGIDRIEGGSGDDYIDGGAGHDIVGGGRGRNTIENRIQARLRIDELRSLRALDSDFFSDDANEVYVVVSGAQGSQMLDSRDVRRANGDEFSLDQGDVARNLELWKGDLEPGESVDLNVSLFDKDSAVPGAILGLAESAFGIATKLMGVGNIWAGIAASLPDALKAGESFVSTLKSNGADDLLSTFHVQIKNVDGNLKTTWTPMFQADVQTTATDRGDYSSITSRGSDGEFHISLSATG